MQSNNNKVTSVAESEVLILVKMSITSYSSTRGKSMGESVAGTIKWVKITMCC